MNVHLDYSCRWERGEYYISTDPTLLDPQAVFDFLTRSYWAEGRSFDTVERSLRHSLCFGVFYGSEQIGLARLVTDYSTVAYVCDVYILERHRGKGLGTWLINIVTEYPDLKGLRRWFLTTRNAHELYRQFGFHPLENPERFMEKSASAP